VPDAVADALVQARKQHTSWGPKKLRAFVAEREPDLVMPAASTIGELLKKRGLIHPRRRRLRVPLHSNPLAGCSRPNELWCVDFKGHFGLGDRSRCHPLTITDQYSRYLLKCEGMLKPKGPDVQEQFERTFREFGLPERIRSDNGPPFASVGLGGLTELSVWWLKLGIIPERIEPGRPEQNGQHERMHRTLKHEATSPACATLGEQQRVFDHFRHEFNDERPHEALGQKQPAKVYVTSARSYPACLREPSYGDDVLVRRVDKAGGITRRGKWLRLASCLHHEPIGLRPVEEDRWELFYGPVLLGILDETRPIARIIRAA
jgi:transposase InsO family protein